MASMIEARLDELGLSLPDTPAPVGNYVPFVRSGSLVFVSGQVSNDGAGGIKGKVGAGLSNADGYRAARICGLFLLAQVRAACGGDLSRVERVVRLGGFVASSSDFIEHPQVINGVSDLMVEVFADKGRHARAAVGVPALPGDHAVEVDGIFEIC
ncbi:MAG: RidA family protein [Pseudomonadota bacterium]